MPKSNATLIFYASPYILYKTIQHLQIPINIRAFNQLYLQLPLYQTFIYQISSFISQFLARNVRILLHTSHQIQ